MKWKSQLILLIILSVSLFGLLTFFSSSAYSKTLILEEKKHEYDLKNYLQMLLSQDTSISIDKAVISGKDFLPVNYDILKRQSHINSWFKLTLYNPYYYPHTIYLTTDIFPHRVGQWTLYSENQSGEMIKTVIEPGKSHLFLFPLFIPAQSEKTFYFNRIYQGRSLIEFKLSDPINYLYHAVDHYLLLGILYGIPFALIIHSLFVYLFTRDYSYLLYSCFVLSCLFALACKDGLINRLPIEYTPAWIYHNAIMFGLGLSSLLYVLFAQVILSTKKFTPFLNKVLTGFACLGLPLIIFNIYYYSTDHPSWNYLVQILPLWYLLCAILLVMIAATFVLFKGYAPSKYFIIGMCFLLFGYVIYLLDDNNIVALPPVFAESGQWGLCIDLIMQSIALASRYSYIQQAEINAQKEIIHQKFINEELQRRALIEKENLIAAYARFFPDRFLELLDKKSVIDIHLGDQIEKNMTVLFADLRNFTSILEHKSPSKSFQFINNYLSKIGPIIREYEGVIDKYVGDAILAFFDKHNKNSINAAIAITQTLEEIKTDEKDAITRKQLNLHMGIGIHHGPLIVGTIGEPFRMDGTVISDAVNTASRLEALNVIYGTKIIMTEVVADIIKNDPSYHLRFLDRIYVKGKDVELKIFEIFNTDPPDIIEKKIKIQALYMSATEYYQQGRIKEAVKLFKQCKQVLPDDKAILLHIKRCDNLLIERWDEGRTPMFQLIEKIELSKKK